METNVLNAVQNFSQLEEKELSEIYNSSTGINRAGDKLEFFIKDLFCDGFDKDNKEEKNRYYKEFFSHLGTRNNPPDLMVRKGSAVEVKKSSTKAGTIQLNSSKPHQKYTQNSARLTDGCKSCEDDIGRWEEKPLIYAIGRVPRGSESLDFLWLVFGDCWAAPISTYNNLSETISEEIKEGVNNLEYGEIQDSNEVGRITDVDACGRTNLRLRGMWTIDHPSRCFSQYIPDYQKRVENNCPLFVVVRQERLESMENRGIIEDKSIEIIEREISSPDDGNEMMDVNILITN